MIKLPQQIAGMMGKQAMQPAQMKMSQTVDPLERLQQRMAGRTLGGALDGVKKKETSSSLNMFGVK